MNNVIDIATGKPVEAPIIIEPVHIRTAHKLIERVCLCAWRDLRGEAICLDCPENPNRPPDDAA